MTEKQVTDTVDQIKYIALEMGEGFGRDIAKGIIEFNSKKIAEREKDHFYTEVMFHIAPYLA